MMRDFKELINVGFDSFAILCWAFVAFVLLRRFGFREASPFLAGAFAAVAIAALVGDWWRDRRHGMLVAGTCPRCKSRDISNFHRCRAYQTEDERWSVPLTEWQCRECGYNVSESLACRVCPEKPSLWPK